MADNLHALHDSVERLASIADSLTPEQVSGSAYPTEWSIADTYSHLGSGAVIMARGYDDILADTETPADFNQSVWDEWNAKAPADQVREAIVADAALLARLEGTSDADRAGFQMAVGPMHLDFDGAVGLRLNEHALHTWDIEVALRPEAPVAPVPAAIVIDGLQMIAGFTAKPTGEERTFVVRTTAPERAFTISLQPDSAQFATGADRRVRRGVGRAARGGVHPPGVRAPRSRAHPPGRRPGRRGGPAAPGVPRLLIGQLGTSAGTRAIRSKSSRSGWRVQAQ